MKSLVIITAALACAGLLFTTTVRAHDDADEGEITVKGEVLDLACYLGHGAQGAKHADCAKTCIESGLPVGLKAENGTTYVLIGEHKPANATLAAYAGKTITVKGKATERDGMHLLSNIEIVK